jgi:hypothetical protein
MATTDLSDLMVVVGDNSYYSDSFRNAIEDNLEGLINDSTTQVPVAPAVALANQYDFYGLLTSLGLPMAYQYTAMRMNGYRSPADYLGDKLNILIPSTTRVDNIRKLQQTSVIITS